MFGTILNWSATWPHDVLRHEFELTLSVADEATPDSVVIWSYQPSSLTVAHPYIYSIECHFQNYVEITPQLFGFFAKIFGIM